MKKILITIFLSVFAVPSFCMYQVAFDAKRHEGKNITGKKRKRNEKQKPRKKGKLRPLLVPQTIGVTEITDRNRSRKDSLVQGDIRYFSGTITYHNEIDPFFYFYEIAWKNENKKEKTARENFLEMRAIQEFGSLENAITMPKQDDKGRVKEPLEKRLGRLGSILSEAGVQTLFSKYRDAYLFIEDGAPRALLPLFQI